MAVEARIRYRLETFGGLAIAGAAAPLTGAATQRKTLALLAVLAAGGSQGVTREKLLGLFWPDSETDRARRALKQALYSLRRDLGDDLLVGTAAVRLNPERMTSDVREFEEAIAAGELERAAELHRGPFLDGLYLDGAPEFERWLERERARLAHVQEELLERLATAAAAAGDRSGAVGWWRRLAAAQPLSSRVAVELMRALAAAGDPEAALRHARVHEALVRQELETEPDPAVAQEAARLRREPRERSEEPRQSAPPVAIPPHARVPSASGLEARSEPPPAAAPAATPDPSAAPRAAAVASGRRLPRRRLAAILAVALAAAVGALAIGRVGRVGPVGRAAASPGAHRSIAVLPFVDMSADTGHRYFGDGLTEELITALSRIEGLDVAARTSSFALRDARLDVRAIGETLRVATVVEGSFRRDAGRLRVTAQLIDAATGYHLWSGEFDRDLRDVFAVQDEIAESIAAALKVRLVEPPDRARGEARTTSLEAYDLYLRGTFYRNLLSRAALGTAVEYFDSAIALDSGFALAYAGKATAIAPMLYFDLMPRDEALPAMRAAARRALELDDRLGEAHTAAGVISFFYEWDWPAAERSFRRATELSPGDAHSFHHLANWLRAMGRSAEGIAARRRSLALDPLNPRTHITLAGDYAAAGRFEEAAEHYQRAQAIDPQNPLVLGLGPHLPGGRGGLLEARGDLAGAVEEYLAIAARRGGSPADRDRLRRAFAAGGMPAFWRAWVAFDEAHSPGGPNPLRLSSAWLRAGDTARALASLERAYRERNPGLVYFAVDQNWRGMHGHPRVAAILDGLKLPR